MTIAAAVSRTRRYQSKLIPKSDWRTTTIFLTWDVERRCFSKRSDEKYASVCFVVGRLYWICQVLGREDIHLIEDFVGQNVNSAKNDVK
jgi:hypothetical protein